MHISNIKKSFSIVSIALIIFSYILTSGVLLFNPRAAHAATYTVTNNADSGAGSLRQAILDANASGGADVIVFDAAYTIAPTSALPNITGQVEINGYTGAPGGSAANSAANPAPFNGTLTIVLDGSSAGAGVNALSFVSGSENSVVRGLVINGFSERGIDTTASNITIAGNYIGTNTAGTAADANNYGIAIKNDNCTVGGTNPADRNVISGNTGVGITISGGDYTGNTIAGSYIGVSSNGTGDVGNGSTGINISVGANTNTIGGTTSASTNVISGNTGNGVEIVDDTTDSNVVMGNYIGTDYTGATALANSSGIYLALDVTLNTIGGDSAGERNIISGNTGNGISLNVDVVSNTISGNYIGTDVNGTTDLGNGGDGVTLANASNTNTIGGDATNERNIISGNGGYGVNISGSLTNVVSGNYIGTDVNGTADVGNDNDGINISLNSNTNTIGGDTAAERNVISGNNDDGVSISQSDSNVVTGNYIGTDSAGTADLGNTSHGIRLSEAETNTIGGTTSAVRNIISGNNVDGIAMYSTSLTNTVQGNYIGTDVNGSADLGNTQHGISINSSSSGNTIGGGVSGAGNVISGNNTDGINIAAGTSSTTQGNLIGTSADGASDLGNSDDGIEIGNSSSNNTIGGDTALERNVISGNGEHGIVVGSAGSTGTVITGNYIGLNSAGNSNLGNTGDGIVTFNSAPAVTIGGINNGEGNVISGNGVHGIILASTSDSSTIRGNIIGLSASGLVDIGNTQDGIQIDGTSDVIIGGTTAGSRNIISGNNESGIRLNSSTSNITITGNYIGTDINGSVDLGNTQVGVDINSSTNIVIGGTTAGSRNIISGNNQHGINIYGGSAGTTITGNYVGTDVNGTADLGNTLDGISTGTNSGTIIGGTSSAARNIISGNNQNGVYIGSVTTTLTLQGNYIGTDVNGTADLGNTNDGIQINSGSNGLTIGGTASGARNVFSGNEGNGVDNASDGTIIVGNYIGIGSDGITDIGNTSEGVVSSGASTIIGGTASGARNVISGNSLDGIVVSGDGSVIQGNLIGTSADGLSAVGNINYGINIQGANGDNIVVGGSTSAARNVISATTGGAQGGVGIVVLGFGTGNNGNKIQGNYVGTNINGDVATGFGNGTIGIAVIGNAENNIIGGVNAGEGNKVAGNGTYGVFVYSFSGLGLVTINNSILGNSITNNGSDGIRLADANDGGFTPTTPEPYPNDAGDTDAITNHFMNFPVISAVTSTNGTATITYNLDINDAEVGATGYRVEFFANDSADASGYGEGQTYLGSDTVSGDVTGKQVTITLPANVSGTKYISAVTTMTDNSTDGFGHSSEFAADVEANLVPAVVPIPSILASTGGAIKLILLIASLLLAIGVSGLYIRDRSKIFLQK